MRSKKTKNQIAFLCGYWTLIVSFLHLHGGFFTIIYQLLHHVVQFDDDDSLGYREVMIKHAEDVIKHAEHVRYQ
jgi:hypothetical protein